MLDTTRLLDFLAEVDRRLQRRIMLVAVGGTAMTLLKLKSSTIDVDFTIPSEFYAEFSDVLDILRPGFKVDLYKDGMVFVNALPPDYLKQSIPIPSDLKHIELRALHPVDIVVTKIGRLDARDEQDIESCIQRFRLKSAQIEKRAKEMGYAANEDIFEYHLGVVLKKFFGK